MGVDPDRENELTRIRDKLVEGTYLTNDDAGAMIAQGLADYLNIGVGDTLILLGQGYHGVNAAGLFPVKGILRFPIPQQNDQLVYLSLSQAQWFYGAEEMATSLALVIDDVAETSRIVSDIESKIGKEEYETMDWKELVRSEEHTSELQSRENLVCRLLLEKKNKKK